MISQQRAVVRMPDVTGLSLRKARLIVENTGLALEGVVFMESYEARDTVLVQRPARGQMVYAGEKVLVGVSRDSYARWLPSIYQRPDANGRNFVKEFLWIVQHLFSSIEEKLDLIHTFFDSYEAPESFLPWLAAWSAMVLEEDWPLAKKRRLIKKAIELYRIRGTVKCLKLFISLFTGHEPTIRENEWPFRGFRVGVHAAIGIDSVVLPTVNLAHTFVVEMPVSYKDLSPEAVIRIHEIIQTEKPANTQYYLRFAVEEQRGALHELMIIGTRSGIGLGLENSEAIESEEELQRLLEAQREAVEDPRAAAAGGDDDPFAPTRRGRPPLPKAPRADNAPVEGREVRTELAGGFGAAAREMQAVTFTEARENVPTREMAKATTGATPAVDPNPDDDPKNTGPAPADRPRRKK